jgi:hypothetical protein
MYLTASNLVYYLISRGVVTADSVVDGDLTIVEAGRRNRNFKVLRDKSPGLFVKQIKNAAPESIATHRREAAFYEMVCSRPCFAVFAQSIPTLRDYNPLTHSLIVDLIPNAESLAEYHMRLNQYPEQVGGMLGRALGISHAQVGWVMNEPAHLAIFPRQMPWMFTLDPKTLYPLTELGLAGKQMAAILEQQPDLVAHLCTLRNEWRFDALVHGDMKWDNCLISQNGDGETDFRVVDWELADVGDASWDIGSLITSYIAYWLFTIPAGVQTEETLAPIRATQASMRPPLRAFWQTYISTRGFDAALARTYLERCLRFAGARLVLAVFEFLFTYQQITPNALTMLQMSRSLFESPSNGVREWFELSEA